MSAGEGARIRGPPEVQSVMMRQTVAVGLSTRILEVVAEPTERDGRLLNLDPLPEQLPCTAFDDVVLFERLMPSTDGAVGELYARLSHHRVVDLWQCRFIHDCLLGGSSLFHRGSRHALVRIRTTSEAHRRCRSDGCELRSRSGCNE